MKADLREVNLESAILIKTKFEDVDLRNADLSWSELTEVNLENVNLDKANLEDIEYDENCKFPRYLAPLLLRGIWIDSNRFVKFEEINCLEISIYFDRLSDYFEYQGLGQEFSKLITVAEVADHYSYYYDIKMNDINISVSDLDFGGWDYEKLHIRQSPEIVKTGSWLYQLEDAIETGDVELSLFIYT